MDVKPHYAMRPPKALRVGNPDARAGQLLQLVYCHMISRLAWLAWTVRPERREPACIDSLWRRLHIPSPCLATCGLLGLLVGCRSGTSTCARCDTVVIAATGEPTVLLPPLVRETVGRDIGDLVFERLAVLPAGASPGDPGAYTPG